MNDRADKMTVTLAPRPVAETDSVAVAARKGGFAILMREAPRGVELILLSAVPDKNGDFHGVWRCTAPTAKRADSIRKASLHELTRNGTQLSASLDQRTELRRILEAGAGRKFDVTIDRPRIIAGADVAITTCNQNHQI